MWYWAEYSTFSISDEAGLYQLTVAGYSGDAGDALMTSAYYGANGRRFSTSDNDNDGYPGGSCAAGNGWWFGSCSTSVINTYDTGRWDAGIPGNPVGASHMLVKYK